MNTPPTGPAVSLADAEQRYKDAVELVLEAYAALDPAPHHQIAPAQLHAGVQQFFAGCVRAERGQGARETVTRAGEYGISLLMDMAAWAERLGLHELEAEFDVITLAVADWIVRHGGEIHTIEPVVDALANQANQERSPASLERLTHLATRIIRSTAPLARRASERAPNAPWRLLNLNYGIIATRTHNPALMEYVFDELVRNVPDEAPRFFAEGMQQMEKFDFPLPVRAVMARYFDRWTRPRMN